MACTTPALAAAQACVPHSGSGWDPTGAGTPGAVPGCPPLEATHGGTLGYGTHVLTRNDDDFDGPIDISVAFPGGLEFFGGPYTEIYINTNGNITFGNGLSTYTPTPFPRPAPAFAFDLAPMIAAYWADVDTRLPTRATEPGVPDPTADDLVYYDIVPGQITVTWYRVGYYGERYQHQMNFQMILTPAPASACGSHDFDVEFRYNQCGWVAGEASGDMNGDGHCSSAELASTLEPCTPAQVGFDAMDGTNFVATAESLTNAIENVCVTSNVGVPGVYRFQVRGGALVCTGGGDACTVAGAQGACVPGINVCHGAGVQCQSLVPASAEVCDDIDNDCNGVVDGAGLCGSGESCVHGVCVQSCIDSGCPSGFACNSGGQCVETACATVTCPAGEHCVAGVCGSNCVGITCPHGQQCASGRCVDPCSIVRCTGDAICVDGTCLDRCPCHTCDTSEVCQADGTCVPSACDMVTCAAGQYCEGGTCMDACTGVVCPRHQHCATGTCLNDPMPDAGMRPDAAIVFNDAAFILPDGGPVGMDSGRVFVPDVGVGPRVETGSCGCRAGSRGPSGVAWLGFAVLAIWVLRRRRARPTAAALLGALTLLVPVGASAQATLVTGLGGPRNFGTNCLSDSDDGSSPAVPLATAFPLGLDFFGTTQSTAYVNVNGNITFNDQVACYTPTAFPVAMQPMIAPFWGDVDLRSWTGRTRPLRGRICNGGADGLTTCPAMLLTTCSNPTSNGIWYHLEPNRMVVTWDQVGYFQCQDGGPRNSFQLILTAVAGACGASSIGTDFDVEFRYNRCEWEVGQASGDPDGDGLCSAAEISAGCTPAQAGFDAGNMRDYQEIAGSRMRGIATTLCTGSNTMPAQPGVWQFQVRGGVVMTCPGAGATCTVPGVMGVCAQGRMSCAAGSSTPTCTQQITPIAERCDNQDNDCDGTVDETDLGNLCGSFETCQAGTCVEGCFEGTCPAGYTCDAAHCVDPACVGVTCGAGERCVMGTCIQPCSGVVCPHGQTCNTGRCVDPCGGITCDACTACVDGTCATRCTATSCPAGQECAFAAGVCVPSGCASVTCPAGQYCSAGTCMDACAGATCPAGQVCSAGNCVPMAMQDAAVGPVDVGIVFNDANIMSVDTGPVTTMDAGVTTMPDGGPMPHRTTGACGCRVERSDRPWSLALAAVLAGSLALRRRRRAAASAR